MSEQPVMSFGGARRGRADYDVDDKQLKMKSSNSYNKKPRTAYNSSGKSFCQSTSTKHVTKISIDDGLSKMVAQHNQITADYIAAQAKAQEKNKAVTAAGQFKVEILWDDRERDTDMVSVFKQMTCAVRSHLDAGDVILLLNKKLVYVIERKRTDDLSSSIRDGRLKKQSQNMAKLFPDLKGDLHRCIIMLEKKSVGVSCQCEDGSALQCKDDLAWYFGDDELGDDVGMTLDREKLRGALWRRYVEFGFQVSTTESAKYTTFDILKLALALHDKAPKIWNRYHDQPDFDPKSVVAVETTLTGDSEKEFLAHREMPSLPREEKLNALPPESRELMMQLMVTQGITHEYAYVIVKQFSRLVLWSEFMIEHRDNPQQVVDRLANLTPIGVSATDKRLGPARVLSLFHTFHGYDVLYASKQRTKNKQRYDYVYRVLSSKEEAVQEEPETKSNESELEEDLE